MPTVQEIIKFAQKIDFIAFKIEKGLANKEQAEKEIVELYKVFTSKGE